MQSRILSFQGCTSPLCHCLHDKVEIMSALRFALRGHRTDGGWLHAWLSIDSLFIKHQLPLCLPCFGFIILSPESFLFFHSFIQSLIPFISKGDSWSYL